MDNPKIMTLRMGKAGALFLWVCARQAYIHFVERNWIRLSDIRLPHGLLRLPNRSPGLLPDGLRVQP